MHQLELTDRLKHSLNHLVLFIKRDVQLREALLQKLGGKVQSIEDFVLLILLDVESLRLAINLAVTELQLLVQEQQLRVF